MTTQNKNVPALRFPEFNDQWEIKDLEKTGLKVIDGDRGSNYPNGNDFSAEGYCLFMNAKNVTSSGFAFTEKSFITKEKDAELRKGKLKRNDLVLTTRGTVGNMAFYDEKVPFEHLRINSGMVLIRNENSNINPNYIYIFLASPAVQKNISNIAFGSAQPQLTVKEINKFKISLPSLPEQQKIAAFLTAVDEKIQQLTKKKDLLEQYKKGVMQQIFNQEIRFKDNNGNDFADWEEKKLGEVYNITSSKRVFESEWTKTGVPFYRAREIVKLNENGFVENELFISNEMYENYKAKYGVPQKNDLLVTGVGTIGKLYLVKDNERFYFKDGNIIWFKNLNLIDSQFVKQLFNSRIIQKQIEENASITTVGTYTIDSAKKTSIPFPSIPEQEKISNFLSAIDDKISLVNQQLEKTQTFKKGLLQMMFV